MPFISATWADPRQAEPHEREGAVGHPLEAGLAVEYCCGAGGEASSLSHEERGNDDDGRVRGRGGA
jgi:hypothetical protein